MEHRMENRREPEMEHRMENKPENQADSGKIMQFASDLPYPKICVEAKNPVYGREMLSNMGGRNSEMTTIAGYFYNNLVTCEYEEISKIFEHVMIVEMHHLHLFGEMAMALGENPRLWTYQRNRPCYWSPSYYVYPAELKRLLQQAVEGERAAVVKYQQQAMMILEVSIVENLKRIILDEEIHIQLFETLLRDYCGAG